jgi:hypothetical protein
VAGAKHLVPAPESLRYRTNWKMLKLLSSQAPPLNADTDQGNP